MNDKLKIIAEYDGWEYDNQVKGYCRANLALFFSKEDEVHEKYITSLDFLHPVAMKVLGELEEARRKEISLDTKPVYDIISTYIDMIKQSCAQPPINGEYSDLFNATVEGIIYLQNHSK
jgi:hypothetical protein